MRLAWGYTAHSTALCGHDSAAVSARFGAPPQWGGVGRSGVPLRPTASVSAASGLGELGAATHWGRGMPVVRMGGWDGLGLGGRGEVRGGCVGVVRWKEVPLLLRSCCRVRVRSTSTLLLSTARTTLLRDCTPYRAHSTLYSYTE